MAKHLLRDMELLKKELLLLGARVEEATHKAILAFVDRRTDLADDVIRGDKEVDEHEVRLEESCLKVLALHQPVANDLRFLVAVLKVNNDLERVGDLAQNVAERSKALGGRKISVPAEIRTMSEKVREMLRGCLNAVVEADVGVARQVLASDEEVDALHKRIYEIVQERILADPEQVAVEIQMLTVSRCLERIADLATNIAEDVVFMVEGEVIRHQGH